MTIWWNQEILGFVMYFWESFWCVSEEICYLRTSLPSLPVSFFLFLSAVLLTVSIDYINTRPLYFPFSNLVLLVKRSQVSHTHTHTCTDQRRQLFKQTKWVRWGVIFSLPQPASCSIQSLQPCPAWKEKERKIGGVPTYCPINTLLVHLSQFGV